MWHSTWATRVYNIQSFCGSMVYEGCLIPLWLMMTRFVSWENLLDIREDAMGHCRTITIESGISMYVVPMYNLIVKIDDLGDIDVFEGARTKFLGMFGCEWESRYDHELPSNVATKIEGHH